MSEPAPAMARILQLTAASFGMSPAEIRSRRRAGPTVLARHCSMWLCRHLTPASLPEIGRAHGDRDHATVSSGVRRIDRLRESDFELRSRLDGIARSAAIDAGGVYPAASVRLRAICDTLAAMVADSGGELYFGGDDAPRLVRALAGIVGDIVALEREVRAAEAVRPPLPASVVDLGSARRRRSAPRGGFWRPGGGDVA